MFRNKKHIYSQMHVKTVLGTAVQFGGHGTLQQIIRQLLFKSMPRAALAVIIIVTVSVCVGEVRGAVGTFRFFPAMISVAVSS